MKILATSDLHLTNKNSKFKYTGNVSDLLLAQDKFADFILEQMKDHDIFIFGGDLTDYATLDPVTLTYTSRWIAKVASCNKPCIFLEGNHCIEDSKSVFTVLGGLAEISQYSNCKFILSPERVELTLGDETLTIYTVPYAGNYKVAEGQIEAFGEESKLVSNPTMLLFHLPCINAVLDNGFPSTKGVKIATEVSQCFDIILGGDYHKHQKLKGTANAYYIGAPFDLKMGEHYDRFVISVELNKGEYTMSRIHNPYQIPLLQLTQEEFFNLDEDTRQKSVIKVKDATSKIETDNGYSIFVDYKRGENEDVVIDDRLWESPMEVLFRTIEAEQDEDLHKLAIQIQYQS